MKIERAIPSDHMILTTITKRSKAYWGYSKEQIEAWDALLSVTPEYITKNETYKLVSGDQVIGYYSLVKTDTKTLKLDSLFILPEFIRKGFGKLLMNDLFERAALNNYTTIILYSDPNAESFYSKFGFVTIGQIKTSVPNRSLPEMRRHL